ncbi:hypothetical protein HY933_01670 [Candidatus Falkowbacteria bacterium]|nr:hypothetical protein [Candidatus Falkowbacteria bacterium]
MPEFKSVITKVVAKTELPFEQIRERIHNELSSMLEDDGLSVQGMFMSKVEFDRFYNTNLFYKYGDRSALALSGITEEEAAKIKIDERFSLVVQLSDARDRVFDAQNIQELDEALAEVEGLFKQIFHLEAGEIEMQIIKMLAKDEQVNREMVDDLFNKSGSTVKTAEEQELLEEMFGTAGSKRDKGDGAEIIKPDFLGPKRR